MKEFETIEEILDFAITAEQSAVDFYTKLAKTARNEEIKESFLQFAKEEISHKTRLTKIKTERAYEFEPEKISDLKIADYQIPVKPSDDMSYQDVLVLAMKREKAAYKLYTHLSQIAPNNELKKTFQALAQEEAKHKLRFEIEYDDMVMFEN
ncbi:MAG: ferritin family protein [Bacteroidetes bacterium]|jgi:rubrerythrin|nr:ferritin family protein [Bacteroidota bacterium]MBT6686939.1 ferritin family protein [Bacteroidota bacterium]MBT7143207.1 ferritin family protein [Bacteroidota bacterium]MBT7492815.1 ferritin family protein [Bacteroidota bacterium]